MARVNPDDSLLPPHLLSPACLLPLDSDDRLLSDLTSLHKQGKLETKLKEAGVL